METKSEIQKTCSEHSKAILYYCMDPRCKKAPQSCIICIKNDHHKCKDELLVESDEKEEKINLIKSEQDPTMITNQLNQILELKLYEMNKSLMLKKENFISSFNIQDSPKNIFSKDVLDNIKKNFNFDFDEESEKINVSSKFNATEEQITESVGVFEKNLEKKILNFLDEFSKLKFAIKGNLSADDWICHNNIEIEEIPEGLHFQRKPEDTSNNYFTALYTIPLDSPCTFKINVEEVYPSDRYVDFGIMKKSKYETTKSNFINSFNSGAISYCGYSLSGGITGTSLTTGSSNEDGLKSGSHFYLHYDPGVEVKFYDDDGKIDLKKSMTGDTEEYYLFCVIYHPPTKYYIERID